MYIRWPEFTYCRAGSLNGKKRNILPKTINDGAQYLLIDDNPITNGILHNKCTYPMACATPASTLYIDNPFSTEIINFLKFKAGRTFNDLNGFNSDELDDWSKMIWDLLYIASAKYSTRKNIDSKFARKITYGNEFLNCSTKYFENDNLLYNLANNKNFCNKDDIHVSEDSSGVPTIIIESFFREQ